MLATFLDRVYTPSILYPTLLWLIYHFLAPIAPPILVFGLLAPITAYWLSLIVTAYNNERKIDARGLHAPSYRTWSPWNVGMLFEAIYYFMQHRNHEWWLQVLGHGNPNMPHTTEAIAMGGRIVFTIDEENIKAILATQFADYGKGDQFRRDWKQFLGLSELVGVRSA